MVVFSDPIVNLLYAAFKNVFGFLCHSQSHSKQYPLLLLQNFLMLDEVSNFKPEVHGSNENIILHVQDLTCYWDKVNLLTY